MEKRISLFIVCMMLVTTFSGIFYVTMSVADPTPQTLMGISLSNENVVVGNDFTATIYINPPVAVGGWEIYLFTFDPAVCHANTVVAGAEWTTFFDPGTIDNVNGKITQIQSFKVDTYPAYNHTACQIQFTATSPGVCNFLFVTVEVDDTNFVSLPVQTHNATFTIKTSIGQPPIKPNAPSGKTNGKVGQEYSYSTSTSDPDGDQVYYLWDWGDGNNNVWLGPFNSGATCEAKHTWNTKDNYNVKVKAKDTSGKESSWSDPLPVTMPFSYHMTLLQLLQRFFERFPHLFPILRQLLDY